MNTVDQLLAETGRVQDLGSEGLARGRDALDDALNALNALDESRSRLQVARFGSRRRRLALAGLAVAGVAAVITIPVVTLAANGPSAKADAATVLRQAGTAAGTQPGGWPDATYWHAASSYVRFGKTYQRDIWIARNGQSILRDTGLPNPQNGVIDGQPRIIAADSSFGVGGMSLTWSQLYALPTDPAQLKSVLRADVTGYGPDPTTELFDTVGDLLRESPASPALREALYDVAADIPGVRVTGPVTDAVGRTGTAIKYGTETYVIDQSNGQLLADEQSGWTSTYLSQGPANDAPPLPTK